MSEAESSPGAAGRGGGGCPEGGWGGDPWPMGLGLGERRDESHIYAYCVTSAKIGALRALFFSLWAAPSEGRRWYPRKPLHLSQYRIGGSPLLSQTRWSSRRGVKGIPSLWCLSMLLLFGSNPNQLATRALWCSIVCCFPHVVLLDCAIN